MKRILVLTLIAVLAGAAFSSRAHADATFKSLQWGLRAAHVYGAWKIDPARGSGIVVCDVGTGVDPTQIDLREAVIGGVNTVDPRSPGDYSDGNDHDTHTAGIIAARGHLIWGVAPRAKLLIAKSLSDTGDGSYGSVSAGILWCATHKANVISLSLGGPSAYFSGMVDAVRFACQRGIAVSVAAGNNGDSTPQDPADVDSPCLIAVEAETQQHKLADFSSYGQNHRSVTAPGVNIVSDFPGDIVALDSGTSMACPMVTGVLALLMGMGVPADEAVAIVQATADPPKDDKFMVPYYGAGLLDAKAAVAEAIALGYGA